MQGRLLPIPLFRYGHCAFTAAEVQAAFAILVWKATGQLPALPAEAIAAQAEVQVAEFSQVYLPLVSQTGE